MAPSLGEGALLPVHMTSNMLWERRVAAR